MSFADGVLVPSQALQRKAGLPAAALRMYATAKKLDGTADGTRLASLVDESTYGNHPVTTDPSYRPYYVTNDGTGRKAVAFNGAYPTGQGVGFHHYQLPDAIFAGLTEGELFAVVRLAFDPTTGVTGQGGLWNISSSGSNTHFPWHVDGNVYDGALSTTRKGLGNPAPDLSTVPRILNVSSKAGEWVFRLDGAVLYSTNVNAFGVAGAGANRFGLAIPGNAVFFSGWLYALAFYGGVLDAATRTKAYDFLKADNSL